MLEMVAGLNALYARIDQQVKEFQLKTGLRCAAGCGVCCPTAEVHASVLEMLPAAHEILCRGASAFWLDRIEAEGTDGVCVFYANHRAPDAPGHCGLYAFRPTVCRLFGFAAVRIRTGAHELSICKQVKRQCPEAAAAARSLQGDAPCFADVGVRVSSLDISSGTRLMPINEALRGAILRLGLTMQMSQGEALGIVSAA